MEFAKNTFYRREDIYSEFDLMRSKTGDNLSEPYVATAIIVYNCIDGCRDMDYADMKAAMIEKERKRTDDLKRLCDEGSNPEYNHKTFFLPMKMFQSPVRVPAWMFRKYDIEILNLNDIEKVALAHVIYFTNAHNETGYMAMSCNIENWCRCTPDEADSRLSVGQRYRGCCFR